MAELLIFFGLAFSGLLFIIFLTYGYKIDAAVKSKIDAKKKAIKSPYIRAYFDLPSDQDWVSWAEKDRIKALKEEAKKQQESIPSEYRLYPVEEHVEIQENLKKLNNDK